MKKRKSSNAKCATKAFFVTMSWKDICHQFMEERSLSNVNCAKKSFSDKGNMTRDMSSVHEEKKVFKCKVCDKSFSQKTSMTRHMVSFMNRHVPRSKNLGGHIVMWRAAACRRRLLICQNLGGHVPPLPPPPLAHAWWRIKSFQM